MKALAIIQARMGSTRLPGKSLLPLAGVPLIQQLVERVQRSTRLHGVVLAYPHADHDAFRFLAHACPTLCLYAHHGDEHDLVGRYVGAARAFEADVMVRVPGDNPCIDPVYLDEALLSYLTYPFAYYSNTTAAVEGTWVDGVGGEVLSRSRLHWLDQRTKGHATWREHPHRYFEEQGLLDLPKAAIRLDVNDVNDYDYVRRIYDHFGHNRFTAEEVVASLQPRERLEEKTR